MRSTSLLLLGLIACKKTPTEAAPIDAGSSVVASAVVAASASAAAVVVADAAPPPLTVGHRVVSAFVGDPAARGCTLREDTGELKCSDDSFRETTHAVPKATATAAIERIVAREATCTPRRYPEGKRPPPGRDPAGSIHDATRSERLCDATTVLAELRTLERTYR